MTNQIKIEDGGWTPALKQMAIELLDEIMMRPISTIISDPRNGSLNTFQGVRDKLSKKKYSNLYEWKIDVLSVISNVLTEDPLVESICEEIKLDFLKKYLILEEFSLFKFKNSLGKIISNLESIQTDFNVENVK